MKVAVSIPDPIFQAAERVSKRMRISRSQLYAKAVEAFVKMQGGDDVTEQLNRVYSKDPSTLEPPLEAASLEILEREKWDESR